MTKRFLIALAVFILTLTGKLIVDLNLYFNGEINHHSIGVAVVIIALVGCSWAAGWLSAPMWFLLYWILFNGLYAVLIGQNWGYLGTTSKLDIFERENGWVTPVKYILAAGAIVFYIIKSRKK